MRFEGGLGDSELIPINVVSVYALDLCDASCLECSQPLAHATAEVDHRGGREPFHDARNNHLSADSRSRLKNAVIFCCVNFGHASSYKWPQGVNSSPQGCKY